jgi:Zn-dependent protease
MEGDDRRDGRFRPHEGRIYGFLPPRYSLYSAASLEHKVVDFAIQLAVILFAISFHESAHAYAALRFGDTTARDLGRISLNPLRHIDPVGSILVPIVLYFFAGFIFGSAKPTPVDLRNTKDPRLANLVVSAAGPLSNFLLAGLGLIGFALIRRADPEAMIDLARALQFKQFAPGAMAPLTYLLFFFVLVNVMLGVFNLLPIPPLDGSGVLLSLGGAPIGRFFAVIRPFGFVILILLVMSPILSNILRPIQNAVIGLIFPGAA